MESLLQCHTKESKISKEFTILLVNDNIQKGVFTFPMLEEDDYFTIGGLTKHYTIIIHLSSICEYVCILQCAAEPGAQDIIEVRSKCCYVS